MKRIKLLLPALLLAFLAIGISSCKKKNGPKPIIQGGWYEQSVGGQYVRSVFFGADGHFEATFSIYNDGTPGVNTRTVYTGTYTVNGSNLVTTVNTVSVQENGGTPVVSQTSDKLYSNATFSITTENLTVNYDALSPGGPIRVQTVFMHAMED